MLSYKFFAIDFHGFRVEPSDLDHESTLYQHQTGTKVIRLVDIMLSKPGTSVDNMRFPQNRRQILRSTPDCGHGKGLSILIRGIIKIILTLTKIDQLKLSLFSNKNIRRFDIPVTNALTLKK